MFAIMLQSNHPFNFNDFEQMVIAGDVARRLLLASGLGALVGLERELHKKPSGIRTNLLICLGCAFFTLLSAVLAGDTNPDKGRVASNIVQGIGFLGAGLILHNRNRVNGLTSAASVFVVAAIGMACGAGLYVPALLATGVVVLALECVGILETRLNIKPVPLLYEVRGVNRTAMLATLLQSMDGVGQHLGDTQQDTIGDVERITFDVRTTSRNHQVLKQTLEQESIFHQVLTFRQPEED